MFDIHTRVGPAHEECTAVGPGYKQSPGAKQCHGLVECHWRAVRGLREGTYGREAVAGLEVVLTDVVEDKGCCGVARCGLESARFRLVQHAGPV
jgi:hypothetical protein